MERGGRIPMKEVLRAEMGSTQPIRMPVSAYMETLPADGLVHKIMLPSAGVLTGLQVHIEKLSDPPITAKIIKEASNEKSEISLDLVQGMNKAASVVRVKEGDRFSLMLIKKEDQIVSGISMAAMYQVGG